MIESKAVEAQAVKVKGLEVDVITLSNDTCRAAFTNLGARLIEWYVPDNDGRLADIVLQRPSFEDMATDDHYMGATVGRYANRIGLGQLHIDDMPVQLSVNEGSNHLHGGQRGFDRRLWSTEISADGCGVTFWRISPSGEEDYPGTLTTSVTYCLDGTALAIDIRAITDAATIVNISHHSYFNLGGHESGSVLDHLAEIRSSFYVPVDDELLPTGDVLAVDNTPFDFRRPRPIGKDMPTVAHSGGHSGDGHLAGSVGYDHNWALEGSGMREVVVLTDPVSCRHLRMSTNQPGLQLYVGGYLDGVTGKPPAGEYQAYAGVALEAQTFPDAVNHSHFPQATLYPGQTYLNRIRFDLGVVA